MSSVASSGEQEPTNQQRAQVFEKQGGGAAPMGRDVAIVDPFPKWTPTSARVDLNASNPG